MNEKRCFGCMRLKSQVVCEHCGYDERIQNAPHQLPAGTVLRDQYLVGRVLGQGGFGITYLGWDLYLDTPIAIKEYFPSGFVSRENSQTVNVTRFTSQVGDQFQTNRDRFLREAKSLARFSDVPEIVHVRNFFQANGTAYIVMEYINGITLRQYVQNQGGMLSVQETFSILRPVMDALSKVHAAGLIHRDISPDNIMMLPRGGAKLLDFGSVRDMGDAGMGKGITKSTEPVVKPSFAPLEQYQRRGNLGPWTDIYALCATIYYCLTGRVPPEAPDRMMRDEDLDWDRIPGLTPQQIDTLNSGMALLPRNRPLSVDALCQQLFPQSAEAQHDPLFDPPMFFSTQSQPVTGPGDDGPYTAPVSNPGPSYTIPLDGDSYAYTAPVSTPIFGPGPDATVPLSEDPAAGATLIQREPEPAAPPRKPVSEPALKEETPQKQKPRFLAAAIATLALVIGFFTIHIWSEPTCTQPSTCRLCGKEGTEAALGHQWEPATCTTPKTCSRCGATSGEALGHVWLDASCENPKNCARCGQEEGDALGHSWRDATYSTPATCTRCGKTSGNVKGYIGDAEGYWTEEIYYYNGASTPVYALEETITDCIHMVFNIQVESEYGSPYGSWAVFGRNPSGTWIRLGDYELTEDSMAVSLDFDTPVTINAVASVCLERRYGSFSVWHSVTDVQVRVD